jgi:hypothetical protein
MHDFIQDQVNQKANAFEHGGYCVINGYCMMDIPIPSLGRIPDKLVVSGDLIVYGAGHKARLPSDLTILGSLYVSPVAMKNIANISYMSDCGVYSRDIMAVRANGGIRLAVGCFFGTLDELLAAIKERYFGDTPPPLLLGRNRSMIEDIGRKYMAAARQCVKQLEAKT